MKGDGLTRSDKLFLAATSSGGCGDDALRTKYAGLQVLVDEFERRVVTTDDFDSPAMRALAALADDEGADDPAALDHVQRLFMGELAALGRGANVSDLDPQPEPESSGETT
jgi:hypothetical protein